MVTVFYAYMDNEWLLLSMRCSMAMKCLFFFFYENEDTELRIKKMLLVSLATTELNVGVFILN